MGKKKKMEVKLCIGMDLGMDLDMDMAGAVDGVVVGEEAVAGEEVFAAWPGAGHIMVDIIRAIPIIPGLIITLDTMG